MKMEEYLWVLLLYCVCSTSAYSTPSLETTVSAKAPLTIVLQSDYLGSSRGFEAEISGSTNGILSDFDDGWSGWDPYPVSSSSYQPWKRSFEKITGDDTSASDGYYAYIESSSGNRQRLGYLESAIPATLSDGCIEFYYYMDRNAYQQLSVHHYTGSRYKALMSLYYYSGTGWQYGRVQFINDSPPNRIRFYGRVDHGSTGNNTILAIDDVYISEGKCPPIANGTCFGYQPSNSSSMVGQDTSRYSASGVYIGCFTDRSSRAMSLASINSRSVTIDWCIAYCYDRGHMFAGLQYASYCFCGNNTYSRYGQRPDSECNRNCVGNSRQKCGGSWRNSVYSTTAADGICSDFDDGWSGWNPYPVSGSHYQSWKRSTVKLIGDDTNRYSTSDDYYTYIEPSSGNRQRYGYLESTIIPSTWSDGCIEFYYYMDNDNQWLQVQHYIGSSGKTLMVLYNSFIGWQYGRVQFINGSPSNKIRFYGYVRYGSTGNKTILAIDDVYISEGKCSHITDATGSNIKSSTTQDMRTMSPMESKLDVICSDSYMTVYLHTTISKSGNVHFLDPTCTAAGVTYRNDGRWVYLYTRYDQCQTTMKSTIKKTTFRNQIIVSKHENLQIYREEDSHFSVECEINNRGRSSVGFAPEGAGEVFFKRESGNLTFTMALYTNDSYSTPYSSWQYPVEMLLGSNVYVGASVEIFSNDMVLFADSCKATPNPDPDANPQYQLIENSCGVDSTVHFYGQSRLNKTSRVFFSFETFGFTGDYSTVFVHCQLSVCNGSDVQCRRECQQRGRRDVSGPNKLSNTIPIAIGPVILKRPDDDLDVIFDTKDSVSRGIFPGMSTTLLLGVSLVVLAVGSALWIKSRANYGNSYQKLETNVDDM